MSSSPAIEFLIQNQIPHRLFTHAGEVLSVEQAAQERNQRPEQVIRSIVFRLEKDIFLLVLIPGGGRISWKILRRYLMVNRISLATGEEVKQITGFQIGTVSPFGLKHKLRTLVDESLIQLGEISLGSGIRGTAIMMDDKWLLEALAEYETGKFIEQ